MLKNYLKIAFRNLRRQKGYAFINIAGLSLGLACSFFIVLWVVDEVSYDQFHEHRDDLYLAMRHVTFSGQTYTFNDMPDFSFPLLQGDPAGVLSSPDAIAISDRVARKVFGEDWRTMGNALGSVITVDHRKDFRITGVFEDVPEHSTLRFDYIIAVEDFLDRNTWVENWDQPGMQIYVKLRSGSSADDLNARVVGLISRNTGYGDATVFLNPG